MSAKLPENESLKCPNCGHERTSAKTVGRGDDITATCPNCQELSPLSVWRAKAAVDGGGSNPLPPSNFASAIEAKSQAYARTSGVLAAFACFVCLFVSGALLIGFTIAALVTLFDASMATESLASIAHSLAFFRWAFLAFLAYKVFSFAVKKSASQ